MCPYKLYYNNSTSGNVLYVLVHLHLCSYQSLLTIKCITSRKNQLSREGAENILGRKNKEEMNNECNYGPCTANVPI